MTDSARSPDEIQDPRVRAHATRAGVPAPTHTPTTTASSPSNVVERRGWDGQIDFEDVSIELRRRGVNAGLRSLLVGCSLQGIVATIQWWDEQQNDDRPLGAGALVEMIRRGGVTTRPERVSAAERERRYANSITEWLVANFPDLTDERGYPHPAAIVEVTHLHHESGKGSLTVERHGPRIVAAVETWKKRWGPGGVMGPREAS